MDERFVTSTKLEQDLDADSSLRPMSMSEYIGQDKVKEKLEIFIKAARARKENLDHVLLYGPPGLGKTTLAHIIANELGVQFKVTSGPAIEHSGDLAAILSNLAENDVLFIDEIHRLNRNVEEILYPAMEDFCIDYVIGKGPSAQSVRIALPKFTLIGATTRAGSLSSPLRDRFGVLERLEMYTTGQLAQIARRSASILKIKIDDDACIELARRSRGTPRIVNRMLRRVRDFVQVEGSTTASLESTCRALDKMEIDKLGLDTTDRTVLKTMITKFNGGPVGLDTIAAGVNEETITIEDVIEPYLLQLGFIARTSRGRIVLPLAYRHLNLPLNAEKEQQLSLYDIIDQA